MFAIKKEANTAEKVSLLPFKTQKIELFCEMCNRANIGFFAKKLCKFILCDKSVKIGFDFQ